MNKRALLLVNRHARQGESVVVQDRRGDRGEPLGDLAVLDGVPALPGLGEHRAQGGRRGRAPPGAFHERGPVGIERADLGRECRPAGPGRKPVSDRPTMSL